MEQDNLIELTVDIVAAYLSNNNLAACALPELIGSVHSALHRTSGRVDAAIPEPIKPATTARRSITPDYLICLEDGKRFKSLKRHLRTHYNLTPAQYRAKWGLPADYPMVAPNYAKTRSDLARQMGLGRRSAQR